jgi:hypothetical protein
LCCHDDARPLENARLRQRGVPFSERVVEAPEDGAELKRVTGRSGPGDDDRA